VVFLDPPYAVPVEEVVDVLRALRDGGWLGHEALVVVERSSRGTELTWPRGFTGDRRKKYGETTLWDGHATV
jgi:16S rRNA (guanine966-N2)-methyltransferase